MVLYLGKYGSTDIKLPINQSLLLHNKRPEHNCPQYQQFLAINYFKISYHDISTMVQTNIN